MNPCSLRFNFSSCWGAALASRAGRRRGELPEGRRRRPTWERAPSPANAALLRAEGARALPAERSPCRASQSCAVYFCTLYLYGAGSADACMLSYLASPIARDAMENKLVFYWTGVQSRGAGLQFLSRWWPWGRVRRTAEGDHQNREGLRPRAASGTRCPRESQARSVGPGLRGPGTALWSPSAAPLAPRTWRHPG